MKKFGFVLLLSILLLAGQAYGWSQFDSDYDSGRGSGYADSYTSGAQGYAGGNLQNHDFEAWSYSQTTQIGGSASSSSSSTVIAVPCTDENDNGVCDDEEVMDIARCFILEGTIERRVNSMGSAWDSWTLFAEVGLNPGVDVEVEFCTDEEDVGSDGYWVAVLINGLDVGGSGNGTGGFNQGKTPYQCYNNTCLQQGYVLVGDVSEYFQASWPTDTLPSDWEVGTVLNGSYSIHQPHRYQSHIDRWGPTWYSRILFSATIVEINPW